MTISTQSATKLYARADATMFNLPINSGATFAKRIKLFICAALFSLRLLYRSLHDPPPSISLPFPAVRVRRLLFCSTGVFSTTKLALRKVQSERVFRDSRLFLYDTSPSTRWNLTPGSVLRGNFDVIPVRVDIGMRRTGNELRWNSYDSRRTLD